MTDRDKAIEQAAEEHEFGERCSNDGSLYFSAKNSFIKGAKWADKNPPDSRMAMKIEHRAQDLESQLATKTAQLEIALDGLRSLASSNWGRTPAKTMSEKAQDALSKISSLEASAITEQKK